MVSNAVRLLSKVAPNSCTSHDNLDNPDITLVLAPGWGVDTVPLSLATLSSYVRNSGYKILPIDLNVEWYISRPKNFVDMWDISQSSWFWLSHDSVDTLLSEYSEQIEQFINLIIATNTPTVGFVMYVSSEYVSLALIKLLKERKPDLHIIVGGPQAHITMNGREYVSNPDISAVVQSEGEETLVEIIKRIQMNQPLTDCPGVLVSSDNQVKCVPRPFIKDLNSLPIPDYSDYLFSTYKEPTLLPMSTSRSCPNNCMYCNEKTFMGTYRFRSAESLLNELKAQIKLYPNITGVAFQDSVCNGKISALRVFAEGLLNENIQISWYGQAIIRKEMTEELMTLFRLSGCCMLGYGLETTNTELMKGLGKLALKGVNLDHIAENHKKSGLRATYNVMFGLPGETEEDAFDVLEFLRRNAHNNISVNPSSGFCGFCDGTPGWDNPEKYGIDKTYGGEYWSSTDGTNTYLVRLKRFEEFCKVALDLGIPTTYPHRELLSRNKAISRYYIAIGQPDKAIYYSKEWLRYHPEDNESIQFLRTVGVAVDEQVKHGFEVSDWSDSNWTNGISNTQPEILLRYTKLAEEELIADKIIELADKSSRKITGTDVQLDKGYIVVKVDGEKLNPGSVGSPSWVKLGGIVISDMRDKE